MTKKELTSVYYIKKEIKMWEEQLELIEAKKRKLNQQQDRIISWIISIDDTVVRQIMLYRHVRCYSWNTVAQKIGITADSARKQHDRYLQQSQKGNK